MEVAREKPLAPTLFDVIAPRSSQTSTGGASFRDCLVPPSTPDSANSSGPAQSATTSRPSEQSARRDTKPSHEDRRTKHDPPNNAPQAKNEPSNVPTKDEKAAATTEEEPAASAEVSETTAEDTGASSEESDSSSAATEAAELMAAAQATLPEAKPPVLTEADNGSNPEATTAIGEANEVAGKAKADAESKENIIPTNVATDAATSSDMLTTAEVVSARVVEKEEAGAEGKSAGKETSKATEESATVVEVESPEAATTDAVADSPAVAVAQTAVQAVESGKQGDTHEHGAQKGEHPAEMAKKDAEGNGETVNAQQGTKAQTPTETETPRPTLVADESERSEEEQKAEGIEGQRTETVANQPAASPVAADPATPSMSPIGPESQTSGVANDVAVPTDSASTATTNHAPPAVPTAPPRVPPALLRNADGHHSPHARTEEIDPARFLTRVVKAFESAQQRDSEVRLRLHPAELGSLSIEVKVQDSALTARLQAETPEARTALLENLPMLRERLADQGIRIEKFDVDLMDHSDRQPQQSPSEQTPQDDGRRNAPARGLNTTTTRTTEKEIKPAPSLRGSNADRLNVVI